MQVIGIGGQHSNGKDVLADYLATKLTDLGSTGTWKRAAFAAAVKKCFCEYFGVNLDFIEEWKRKDEVPEGFAMNVRKGLQYIGDGFRQIQPDIWIQTCFRFNEPPFIISDARYINEAKMVRSQGGINILLWRPGFENDDPNPSESQIKAMVDFCVKSGKEGDIASWGLEVPSDLQYYDLFIRNDGDKELLYAKADNIVVPFVERMFSPCNKT